MPAPFESIVGRYMQFGLGGRPHRVYFEEAGKGIPLVCLHTAGADGRQFRHLMNDREAIRAFPRALLRHALARQVAAAGGFQDEEYRLTTAAYTEMILAFCDALELERPVVMGCSIGGRIVLNLAVEHASRFRALIGLEAADFQTPWYDTDMAQPRRRPRRRDLRGAGLRADRAAGAGGEPPRNALDVPAGRPRRLQGRPLFLPRRRRPARQDGGDRHAACPLYLLTGEYDFSCSPEDTLRTARSIAGAEVTVMKEVGHFPMSENPAQFRRYILPVLEKIRGG